MGLHKVLQLNRFIQSTLLTTCILCLFTSPVIAGQYVIEEIKDEYTDLGRVLEILEDSQHLVTFEDIKAGRLHERFYYQRDPDRKLNPHSTYWGRITINNQAHQDAEWILYPGYKEFIDVYIEQKDGSFELKKTGFFEEQANKDLKKGRNSKVSLFLKYGESKQIYIKIRNISGYPPNFKVRLRSPHLLHQELESRNYRQGLFQGLLLILFLYNFLIFILNRDRTYLYYALYLLMGMLYFFSSEGFLRELVLKDGIKGWQSVWIVAIALSPAFYTLFMRDFLDTKTILPKWDRIFRIAPMVMAISVALQLLYFYISFQAKFVSQIAIYQTLLSYLFMLVCMVVIARTKSTLAYFFLLGSAALWLGIVTGTATVLLSEDTSRQFVWWCQAGLAAEALLFSLGLGYRMRKNEEEKRAVQESLIAQLQENEKLQTKVTRELEQKVRERTSEIEQQKEELAAQRDNIEVAYKEISNQNELIKEKNQKITASINYAKRIQNAILPSIDLIQGSIPDSFVLFQPRDIVSGDFYWFTHFEDQHGNQKEIIAAVDCTGHGVPGAIMSMIGNDLLTEAVKLQKLEEPQLILEYMSANIKSRLRQDALQQSIDDGMDMALCIIDRHNKELQFAGAKNPLIYVQDGAIHEIKGNKHPIGGYKNRLNTGFTKHSIPLLDSPSTFYIFSDGYQDQFGGDDNKKLMKKQLKKLFLDIHDQPMDAQHDFLEKHLANWMGKQKQLDDILVIGFKV